jgi:hypothetical protein|tara:strand:- start:530 stop:784 length:255 start_codon:yes stop_codon:yes gene_type:complete
MMEKIEAEARLRAMMNDQPGGGFSNNLRALLSAGAAAYLHADLGNRAALCALSFGELMNLWSEHEDCTTPGILSKAGYEDERTS